MNRYFSMNILMFRHVMQYCTIAASHESDDRIRINQEIARNMKNFLLRCLGRRIVF